MGVFRARDLLRPPNLVSLARLPLAALFVACVDVPAAALLVLAAAGLSDVLDGWLARRLDMATATGAFVDPIADKLFVLTVVITLVAQEKLSLLGVALLSTRELGELPLVAWFAVSRRAPRERTELPRANVVGKVATTLQFGTIAAALFGLEGLATMLLVTAVGGAVAAMSYWLRALRGSAARTLPA